MNNGTGEKTGYRPLSVNLPPSDQLVNNFLVRVANMLQPQALREMVQHALEKYGSVEILINNAGIWYVAPFDEESPEEK